MAEKEIKKKSPSKHIDSDAVIDRDEMAVALQKELNKSRKDGSKVSYFLDEEDDPSMVTDWLSTGSTMLDLAISNRKNGGMPSGKFIELSGLEGTGKSLLCAQMIAETQKRGGLAVFFDSEFAVEKTFWKALGINVRDVQYVPFVTLEELFTNMELCIGAFRKMSKDRLLTIFVDSLTQASVETEMEGEHGVSGYNTGKAIIIAKAMRKITGLISRQRILTVFTNQLRYNMATGGNPNAEKWITPGGKAFPYACSVRIRFANLGKLTKGDGDKKMVIGMKAQAQVIKNRMGPNWRTAAFEIHYDSGIQNYKSWIDFMKLHGIITGDWRGWKFTRKDDSKIEFTTAEFVELMGKDEALKAEVYDAICDKYIMQYQNPDTKAIVEDVQETGDQDDDITKNSVKEDA
jgi:recombination protein RecA